MPDPIVQAGVSFNPSIGPPIRRSDKWNLNGFTFDAWLKLHHSNSLVVTQHPVETGASIADHCYVNPRRFSFEIGFSDVARSLIPGHFFGATYKSVNAYGTLVNMQRTRQPLYLLCKYGPFENILIENIEVPDDFLTKNAMKATINLVQIITASTIIVAQSVQPQDTNQTNRGQVSPKTPTIQGVVTDILKDVEDVAAHLGGR